MCVSSYFTLIHPLLVVFDIVRHQIINGREVKWQAKVAIIGTVCHMLFLRYADYDFGASNDIRK